MDIEAFLPFLAAYSVTQRQHDRPSFAYDAETDVLHIAFDRDARFDETIALDAEGMILRFRRDKLIGATILDASARYPELALAG